MVVAIVQAVKRGAVKLLNKYLTGESMHYRQIIAIILPLLVDQAFIIGLSMLNTAMISSSGMEAVSAVNMVDSVNIFLLNVFIAIATGGTVVVAQYKGSGNDEMVSKSAAQTISSVAMVAVVISVLVIVFHDPILKLLFGGAEPAVFENAQIYLIGSAASYAFIAVTEAVCGALRGVAQTRSSLVLSVITNVSYVLLNVVFITFLHWGVAGMVTSMLLARGLGMICSIVYLLKINTSLHFRIKDALRLNLSIQKKILFIGIPFAAEQMFFNGGKILTQTFVVQLGTVSMTVNAISWSLTQLFQIAGNALNLSVVTVVGQCIGRRNIKDARKFIKSFVGLGSISFVLSAAILLPLFPVLVQLFSPAPEIVPTIFEIVLVTGICQPFLWSLSFIVPSSLRAAGDSKYTSVVSLLSMWLFRVALGYVLGILLNFGIMGVWVAMIGEWGVRGVIFMIRFHGQKWYQHRLID